VIDDESSLDNSFTQNVSQQIREMEERGEIIRNLEQQLDYNKLRKNYSKSVQSPEKIEKFKKREAIAREK